SNPQRRARHHSHSDQGHLRQAWCAPAKRAGRLRQSFALNVPYGLQWHTQDWRCGQRRLFRTMMPVRVGRWSPFLSQLRSQPRTIENSVGGFMKIKQSALSLALMAVLVGCGGGGGGGKPAGNPPNGGGAGGGATLTGRFIGAPVAGLKYTVEPSQLPCEATAAGCVTDENGTFEYKA